MGGVAASGRAPIPREKILAASRAGPEAIVSLIQYLQDLHEAELREVRVMIDTLSRQVKQLQQQLHSDSHNSSKPPSSDGPARRPYVKREKSTRTPGGQPGHEETTLQRVAAPDEVVVHRVTRCRCGHSLREQPVAGYAKRQIFEIPRVHVEVTEHQAEIKRCPACGRASRGQFPPEVNRAVQYGVNLRSYLIYLKEYSLVPYQRFRQLMKDLFGVPLSSGTLFAVEQ